eukprot:scaffold245183_cov33-Prasinocladus_malaysianus.AAC.2
MNDLSFYATVRNCIIKRNFEHLFLTKTVRTAVAISLLIAFNRPQFVSREFAAAVAWWVGTAERLAGSDYPYSYSHSDFGVHPIRNELKIDNLKWWHLDDLIDCFGVEAIILRRHPSHVPRFNYEQQLEGHARRQRSNDRLERI